MVRARVAARIHRRSRVVPPSVGYGQVPDGNSLIFLDFNVHHERRVSAQDDPDSGPSFAKFLLAREMDLGMDETEMAFLAGGLFSAGSESVRHICS